MREAGFGIAAHGLGSWRFVNDHLLTHVAAGVASNSPPSSVVAVIGRSLSHPVVHGMPVIPVAIENVLVDRVAFLGIKLPGERLRQPVQRLLNRNAHGRAGAL